MVVLRGGRLIHRLVYFLNAFLHVYTIVFPRMVIGSLMLLRIEIFVLSNLLVSTFIL